jgi:SAM-dependent methyltransferase
MPEVSSVPGSAEELPLPDASLDAVLAGQAMHWFDMDRALPEIARVLRPGGVLAGLWNVDDDRVRWVAGLAEISKRKSSITLTTWRGSAAKSRQEQMLREVSDLFAAAEVGEFGHGQARTADSLLATIGTHSHLLVMEGAERARLLARVGDFLRSQPETAHGEFTLPMVTVGLRARRR